MMIGHFRHILHNTHVRFFISAYSHFLAIIFMISRYFFAIYYHDIPFLFTFSGLRATKNSPRSVQGLGILAI